MALTFKGKILPSGKVMAGAVGGIVDQEVRTITVDERDVNGILDPYKGYRHETNSITRGSIDNPDVRGSLLDYVQNYFFSGEWGFSVGFPVGYYYSQLESIIVNGTELKMSDADFSYDAGSVRDVASWNFGNDSTLFDNFPTDGETAEIIFNFKISDYDQEYRKVTIGTDGFGVLNPFKGYRDNAAPYSQGGLDYPEVRGNTLSHVQNCWDSRVDSYTFSLTFRDPFDFTQLHSVETAGITLLVTDSQELYEWDGTYTYVKWLMNGTSLYNAWGTTNEQEDIVLNFYKD